MPITATVLATAASHPDKVALTEVEAAFDGVPGLGAVCAVAFADESLGSVVARGAAVVRGGWL